MAEGLAEGSPVFVPRLNSLFSERDVENAIIMAVRRLGYNGTKPGLTGVFAWEGCPGVPTHGNWEVVVLRQSSICVRFASQ